MKLIRCATAIFSVALIAGCAMPHSEVRSGTGRPTLVIVGLPADATLKLDGLPISTGNALNDTPHDILIEEGMHRIEVERNGAVIHREEIYAAGGERKTVDISGGHAQ